MNPKPARVWPAMTLCGVVLGLLVSAATAQDTPAGKNAGEDESLIREQSIYIPYEKLRKVFEKEGRGVFLPYEKFQALWKAAREKTGRPVDQKPPLGALVTEVDSEATVAKDVVRVEARLKIEILSKGWHEVPLRLADAAIIKATLDGQPARIVADAKKGYKLLVYKESEEPERIELALEYAKAITSTPGRNHVSFQAPRAPVSRWRVRIPEPGVKVNIDPLIAASEVPEGKTEDRGGAGPDETVVLAFVGAAPSVRIAWTPKAEGATGLKALASAEARQQVTISEGMIRTRTELAYTISRAELPTLTVEVPADHKVVNVFDANVREWSVEKSGDRKKITVELFEPAKGAQQVTVELEQFTKQQVRVAEARGAVAVPLVKALDVARQQGVLVVQIAQGLRAEAVKCRGLLQVDTAELPSPLTRGRWDFSYRYATVPFELALAIEKVEPRVLVDSLVKARLTPQRLRLEMSAIYTIQRAGVFRLELDVPEGFDVRRVEGLDVPEDLGVLRVEGHADAGLKAKAVQVDAYHLTGEKKTRLVVNLSRKATGRVGLLLELERELDAPDLLTPTGKAAKIPLPIPRVAPGTVQRDAGRLVVYAPESLRVNAGKEKGLRTISFGEALEGMDATAGRRSPGPILAFAYTAEPIELELLAERRRPQVTIAQLLVVRIEDDAVKYRATFFHDVLYSGVKSLRIDVPLEVAPRLRNKTSTIRAAVMDPQPDDVAEGYQAWRFRGETEFIGRGRIELVWEDKIEKLDIGKSVPLTVPRLAPVKADQADVDRAWGQIVLVKAETIYIHEGEPKALRPIDPRHDLMPGAKVQAAARAFEFHDDWSLTVTATRYELEEVKRTSIERAVVRMVVTRGNQVTVQALYRMRSARQRLEIQLPEGVQFDVQPLRINGRPVTLESSEDKYFVPLVDSTADEPFLLELRYTVAGDGSRLDLPQFPKEPAVLKVYLCVYLPQEWALLGKTGPWTDEIDDIRWRPHAKSDDAKRVAWVREGIELTGDPAESFPTDGRLHVFSTLRPAPGDQGTLHLVQMNEKALTGTLLAVVVLGGLLLLPAGMRSRALALGGLLTVLVLSGVFFPIFAMQIIDRFLLSAVFLVLVLWVVWYFAWTLPRRRQPVVVEVAEDKGGQADA